jgi:hypothetical protein
MPRIIEKLRSLGKPVFYNSETRFRNSPDRPREY